MRRAAIRSAKRVVVKIGTSLLAPPEGGVHSRRFGELARAISELCDDGRHVVLVSSGAVGLGLRRLGEDERPAAIPARQAAAAIGQIDLCRRFERAFARHGRLVAQLLLTHAGLEQREQFLNARKTLGQLMHDGIVPIVNENDSVATEELRFGDNDQLSAQVVTLCAAELLVMLTDIDGLHDRSPHEPGARRVSEVMHVDDDVLDLAGEPVTALGSGGMRSKLEAARAAGRFGAHTVIADGRNRNTLPRVLAGEDVGTWVHASAERISSRKHWIAFSRRPRGSLVLDSGAVRALLERRASLLPAGVVGVEGRFGVGDLVSCVDLTGREIARGLISYDAADIEQIMGQRSTRIATLLGYSNGNHVIRRDDLIVL